MWIVVEMEIVSFEKNKVKYKTKYNQNHDVYTAVYQIKTWERSLTWATNVSKSQGAIMGLNVTSQR